MRTDNSAVSYLQKNPKTSPRQVRCLEKLQRYHSKISHIPLTSNVEADALSRYQIHGEAKGGWSVLSALRETEEMCKFGDELENGEPAELL